MIKNNRAILKYIFISIFTTFNIYFTTQLLYIFNTILMNDIFWDGSLCQFVINKMVGAILDMQIANFLTQPD